MYRIVSKRVYCEFLKHFQKLSYTEIWIMMFVAINNNLLFIGTFLSHVTIKYSTAYYNSSSADIKFTIDDFVPCS
jgi:hypothetical protein